MTQEEQEQDRAQQEAAQAWADEQAARIAAYWGSCHPSGKDWENRE
jgi:hypothetical protein